MIFLYFILICIAIGLINWFVISPLLEKEGTKKIVEVLKNIWNAVSAFLGAMFAIYAFIATVFVTTHLLSEYWKIEGIGVIALIFVSALTYLAYKKFKE